MLCINFLKYHLNIYLLFMYVWANFNVLQDPSYIHKTHGFLQVLQNESMLKYKVIAANYYFY